MSNTVYICPLTQKLILDPIIASDGYVYERQAFINYIKYNSVSPITKIQLDKNIIVDYKIIEIINNNTHIGINTIYKNDHNNNKEYVKYIIREYEYNKLYYFKNFNLYILLNDDLFRILLTNCRDDNIIKYVIDNIYDMESTDVYKNNITHYVATLGNSEIVKYIVDKKINLELPNMYGSRFIHFILRYLDFETLKYILNNTQLNLEVPEHRGIKPIHTVCRYGTENMIKYLINLNVNLEVKTHKGITPLYTACKYSTPEIIKCLLDKGIERNYSVDGEYIINIICKKYDKEMIQFCIDNAMDIYKTSQDGNNALDIICEYSKMDTILHFQKYLKTTKNIKQLEKNKNLNLDDIERITRIIINMPKNKNRIC